MKKVLSTPKNDFTEIEAVLAKISPDSPEIRSKSTRIISKLSIVFGESSTPIINTYKKNFKSHIEYAVSKLAEDFPSHTQQREALLYRILTILSENIPQLLKDPELPLSIKESIFPEKVVDLLIRMGKIDPAELSCTLDQKEWIKEYSKISTALKTKLIVINDARGIDWNVRQENLWIWCRALLEETSHPLFRLILKAPKEKSDQEPILKSCQKLMDILVEFIGVTTAVDDISDTLSDDFLTQKFTKIPKSKDREILLLRDEVMRYKNGIFLDYFDFTVNLWRDAYGKLKVWLGDHICNDSQPFLIAHYEEIMKSMVFSQSMNAHPHGSEMTLENIGMNLPANMMIKFLRYMEFTMLESLKREYPTMEMPDRESSAIKIIDQITTVAQSLASIANSLATYYRELGENDKSNELFFAASLIHSASLTSKNITLKDHFEEFIRDKGYQNHFFDHYGEAKVCDFLDLLTLRKSITRDIFSCLQFIPRDIPEIASIPYAQFSNALLLCQSVLDSIGLVSQAKQISEDSASNLNKLKLKMRHLELVDGYVKKVTCETQVMEQYATKWQQGYEKMDSLASGLTEYKDATLDYIKSWNTFRTMYLIFKYRPSGTI
jgi:hypothetical protein